MRIKITFISFLLLTVAFLLTGCGESLPEPAGSPQAVIEGYISDGDYPEVYFTTSIAPGVDGSLTDNLIRWGKVTITDGNETYIMTGSADNGNIPPYRYYTQKMRGECGKSYTITADFGDYHVSSLSTIPFPTPIDSIVFTPTGIDTLRNAVLYFTAPSDTPAYYYLSFQNPDKGSRPYPCMMCAIEASRPGAACSMPVMRPRRKINGADYEANFKVGEEFTVYLNRVEREVYDFWSAYDNMVLFTNSPFLDASESLPGNINGGLGIWSAQGRSSIFVKCE